MSFSLIWINVSFGCWQDYHYLRSRKHRCDDHRETATVSAELHKMLILRVIDGDTHDSKKSGQQKEKRV